MGSDFLKVLQFMLPVGFTVAELTTKPSAPHPQVYSRFLLYFKSKNKHLVLMFLVQFGPEQPGLLFYSEGTLCLGAAAVICGVLCVVEVSP